MDCHHHSLLLSTPCEQGRMGFEGSLGIHDAGFPVGEALAQCLAHKQLMPVPVPRHAGLVDPQQDKPEAEDGIGKQRPHENGVMRLTSTMFDSSRYERNCRT